VPKTFAFSERHRLDPQHLWIPGLLEDSWVNLALNEIEGAKKGIGKSPEQHPFEMRYGQTGFVEWESYTDGLERGRSGSGFWRLEGW